MADVEPRRLYFKSFLKAIENSVGSDLFRNFYLRLPDGSELDSLDDGDLSCAYFVSAILTIFKKIDGIHGTVSRTIEEMEKFGWQVVNEPKPGDVLLWEPMPGADDPRAHIGFYVGDGQAISNTSKSKSPQKHDMHYGRLNRKITKVFRLEKWDD